MLVRSYQHNSPSYQGCEDALNFRNRCPNYDRAEEAGVLECWSGGLLRFRRIALLGQIEAPSKPKPGFVNPTRVGALS